MAQIENQYTFKNNPSYFIAVKIVLSFLIFLNQSFNFDFSRKKLDLFFHFCFVVSFFLLGCKRFHKFVHYLSISLTNEVTWNNSLRCTRLKLFPLSLTLSLSLSLSHTHTHTHTLRHAHTFFLSLSHSLLSQILSPSPSISFLNCFLSHSDSASLCQHLSICLLCLKLFQLLRLPLS